MTSPALAIRPLRLQELVIAAHVAARGMRENPLNIAAFGRETAKREERIRGMFRIGLSMAHRNGLVLGAFDGAVLVGVAATTPSTKCQTGPKEKLLLLPATIRAVGFSGLMHVLTWRSRWAAHDLAEPHWHLGPLAVDSDLQGKGIGSALMVDYCARLDEANAVGYLETDKAVNVKFYERFGFKTVAKAPVLNIPNWFMRRAAGG